jgi:cysteinyl-tRNA synthetase
MVGPFVQTILDARTQARDDKRWADADLLRDRLVALGVEVNDSPQGTSWRLLS